MQCSLIFHGYLNDTFLTENRDILSKFPLNTDFSSNIKIKMYTPTHPTFPVINLGVVKLTC